VQTVETTNRLEARRCRYVQYRGQPAELYLNGSRFFGMVQSVQEDRYSSPQRWIVTIVPKVEKPSLVGWRYSTRPLKSDVLTGIPARLTEFLQAKRKRP